MEIIAYICFAVWLLFVVLKDILRAQGGTRDLLAVAIGLIGGELAAFAPEDIIKMVGFLLSIVALVILALPNKNNST